MKNLIKYSRLQFGIALIAFGIQHFIVGSFTIGSAPPWPTSVPGGLLWAYLSGLFLFLTGTMLLINKTATPFLMITGMMIFIWAFVRDLPIFIPHPVYDGFLTSIGEALAMTGCSFIVANSIIKENKPYEGFSFFIWMEKIVPVGSIFIGAFLLICGVQHFILTEYCQSLVPTWIPGSLFWTYFAGVALITCGIGLMWWRVRKVAAFCSGLMVFIWMLILHSLRVARNIHDVNEWSSLLETISLSAALFVLACSTKKSSA